MNRADAESQLAGSELTACIEGTVAQAREMERQLLDNGIPTLLAAKPKGACCGGSCGCGAKVQLLVRPDDLDKVSNLMRSEWLEAVRREGVTDLLVQLKTPAGEGVTEPDVLRCPACNFAGGLINGACGDCGLQLE